MCFRTYYITYQLLYDIMRCIISSYNIVLFVCLDMESYEFMCLLILVVMMLLSEAYGKCS